MKNVLIRSLVLALGVALVSSAAYAKKSASGNGSYTRTSNWSDVISLDSQASLARAGGLNSSAVATTTVLITSKFDSGASCVTNSWVTADVTAQTNDWWHVDDFTTPPWGGTTNTDGIPLLPIQGAHSMWMAALPSTGPVDPITCGYQSLPGYGTGWNQAFCTKTCVSIAGGPDATKLDVAFKLRFDSEQSYDGTKLEYTTDCTGNTGWSRIDGGLPLTVGWNAAGDITVAGSYTVASSPVKVRLHFQSDSGASNQDGGWNQGIGVMVDSLTCENLPTEDFEGEAVGVHSSNDWTSCNAPGYGIYLALFKKTSAGTCGSGGFANYEDQCLDNLGCYWAAICGSTEFYTCGDPAQPTQKIVPHVNVRQQYIANEIWSPQLPLSGSSGSDFRLRYTVYADLPLNNLVFHWWHVRTLDTSGCPSSWQDRNFVYYSPDKAWVIAENAIGSKVNVATGASIQVAVGMIDYCQFWCGIYGDGLCHSPAPYIDSVKVLRISTVGPQWDVRDLETFQDNFSTNGTITGTARMDEANDIRGANTLAIAPGDSAIVLFLVDPKFLGGTVTTISGLSNDPTLSTFVGRHKTKNAVYGYFTVTPFNAAKIGPAISEGPGGTANRYPYIATVGPYNGKMWAQVRMDYTYAGNATNPGLGQAGTSFTQNRFNIDINDNLFTPGDTIEYFYSATSADGTSYFSTFWGTTSDVNEIAANPNEVTILPAGGFNRNGDILYVDGGDGGGTQNYWDGAFIALGIANKIDRYDVRGPSSGVSNRPGNRVKDIAVQLNGCYKKIIWDCSNNSITLGDGTGTVEKTDDYLLLDTFLNNLTNPGGVMLVGDNVPTFLDGYAGAGAVTFRSTYMPFTLINSSARLAPTLFAISPKMMAWPGRAYVGGADNNFVLFGGCPALNNFDVIAASGSSRVEMSYNTASNANGGVVSNVAVGPANTNAHVLMTGFSLAFVRDDELDGISDRAQFVHDSIVWLGNQLPTVTNAGPALKNDLSQNYPNPFNPQTSIAFTIKDRGAVSLKVYNVNGELVRTLANDSRAAGSYTLTWDGHNDSGQPVSSGVYFYKLVANNFSQTKKMVLLK